LKLPVNTEGYEPVALPVAFTPKGGCPLKPSPKDRFWVNYPSVAFTPKGGCPLKLPVYSTTGVQPIAK